MSYDVRFSPEALADLIDLRRFLTPGAGFERASAYVDDIVDDAESLATFPQRGRVRDEIRPGLRVIGYRRRVSLAFTVGPETVTILGVFYAGRDAQAALRQETALVAPRR
ncbi:type II toxin-antitoxin system RelE/ParE family toxin [Methylobacterium sp. 10]|uniref:type II toxin-antitoxin system RelE/ParE family toxin n=1 Tax=Methylobacterium sp. 10 TaxID=1101191 RepID=UPI000481BFE9|nr:type II toxin-antitoxin system RelE/ParE family toxin [Methylobacterium sp. 10]